MTLEDTMAGPPELTAATTATGSAATQPRNPWPVLVIILSAVFMQLLDTTITMVAVPTIQTSLKASYGEVQLVVSLFMLACACVLVTGGRLLRYTATQRMLLWGEGGA